MRKESGKPPGSERLRYEQFWSQEGGRSSTSQPQMEMKAEMQLTRHCGACTRELKLLKFLLTWSRIVLRTWGSTQLVGKGAGPQMRSRGLGESPEGTAQSKLGVGRVSGLDKDSYTQSHKGRKKQNQVFFRKTRSGSKNVHFFSFDG